MNPALSKVEGSDQSKIINYAKQTQFAKKSNVYNLSKNNELQRKMNNGHLVKTNPIQTQFPKHQIDYNRSYDND